MSDHEKRERFGRYLILDHLVDGGMAKICRARFLSEQADKVVAIKMVQPQYSKDEAFKTMFMDEIKLTFGLLHPNIVQTYDYGLQKGQLYVAMEYCDGRNLKEYLEKLRERKFVFPVEISTYIITQACQGLHYAHTYTDKLTGQSTNIIHRDISPHNIMLTYDGAIKIIDFGIAKADTNSEATQAGTIKGKLSYLAPEYLEGLELDSSYDQFALGITLWEMLCSRKLFKANNDLAILKKIQECRIPAPSSINPNVPKELDQIVLKALSKNRKQRFENMDKFNRALMKFLYSNYPDFNSTDLSYFAKELFKSEIKKDREKLFEFGKIDITPYLEELKGDGEQSEDSLEKPADSIARQKERVLDFGFEEEASAAMTKTKTRQSAENSKLAIKEGNLLSTKEDELEFKNNKSASGKTEKKTLGKTKTFAKRKKEQTKTIGVKKRGKSSTRVSQKAKPSSSSSSKLGLFVASIAAFAIISVYLKPNQMIWIKELAGLSSDERDASMGEGERMPSSDHTSFATLQLENYMPHSYLAFVNGERASVGVLGDLNIPSDQDVTLRIQATGREHFVTHLYLNEGERRRIDIPEMPRADYGFLVMSRSCVSGKLLFDMFGEKRVEVLPFESGGAIGFPIKYNSRGSAKETQHTVYLVRDEDGIERRVNFYVRKPDETIDLCRLL